MLRDYTWGLYFGAILWGYISGLYLRLYFRGMLREYTSRVYFESVLREYASAVCFESMLREYALGGRFGPERLFGSMPLQVLPNNSSCASSQTSSPLTLLDYRGDV
jgi:hypothetical protein